MWLMMVVMAFPLLGLVLFRALRWPAALPLYVTGVVVSVVYHRAMRSSMAVRVATGAPAMVGSRATVIAWNGPRGTVRWRDEIWNARIEQPTGGPRPTLRRGQAVRIVAVERLSLDVIPDISPGATEA